MRITNDEIAMSLIKTYLLTNKSVTLTRKQLRAFKIESATEKEMFDKRIGIFFEQTYTLEDVDTPTTGIATFLFLLTQTRGYQLTLFISPEYVKPLKHFFGLDKKGGA